MNLSRISTLLISASVLGRTLAAYSTFPDFTCNVIQYAGNGCNASDVRSMENIMASLFVSQLSAISDIYFADFFRTRQDVFNVTSSTSYSYSYSYSFSSTSSTSTSTSSSSSSTSFSSSSMSYFSSSTSSSSSSTSSSSSYLLPGGLRGRQLGSNICSQGSYCQNNPLQCILAGCPKKSRRRDLQTFDISQMTSLGAAMIKNMTTTNTNCVPVNLGFRCDLV